MKKREYFWTSFAVREVMNGFILDIGSEVTPGGFGDTYVFNTVAELNTFIDKFIKEEAA